MKYSRAVGGLRWLRWFGRSVTLHELSRLLERPQAIPPEGTFTGFLGRDDLADWLPRFAQRRMLASVFGGHRMPRRVMLRLMPPGEGLLAESRLRTEMPRLLNAWEDAVRAFPAKWLRLLPAANAPEPGGVPREGSWHRMLTSQGVQPSWVGDYLAGLSGRLVHMDARRQEEVLRGLERLGLQGEDAGENVDVSGFTRSVTVTVRSLRLDALVSRAFGLPREEAKKAVVRGFVTVNLLGGTDASRQLAAGDLVDCELEGRALVREVVVHERKSRSRTMLTILDNVKM